MDIPREVESAFGGRLHVERELSAGGMSRVFVATTANPARRVVVKVLPPEFATASGIARFRQEIEIAARLQHAHIMPLLDVGSSEGVLAYTMPFVEGMSLGSHLEAQGALPVAVAVRLWREILDALGHAHEHGVIHRDIKPDNILLSAEHATVTDFGIAKALSAVGPGQRLTATGLSIGTPAYMAPEQAAGQGNIDHRADIYSAALVMWEMLAGRHPFAGRSASELIAAQVVENPEPLTSVRRAVPAELSSLVERCLAKNPSDRPQSTGEVRAALDRVPMVSAAARPRVVSWLSGSRVAAAAVVAVLLVGGYGAINVLRTPPAAAGVPELYGIGLIPERVAAEDAELVRGVINIMTPELELIPQAEVVTAYSAALGDYMRRMYGMNPATLTNPDSMRFAARRAQSRAIVMLDVAQLGRAITLTARISAANAEEELGTFTESASDSGALQDAAQRLGRAVANRLRPRLATLPRRRSTSVYIQHSLVAIIETEEGQRKFEAGDYLGGLPHYRRALAIDTAYAWGYRQVGLGLGMLGVRRSEILHSFRKAREFADTGRTAEYLNIMVLYHLSRVNDDSARRAALDYIAMNPRAQPPLTNIASLEMHHREFEGAERWLRQLFALRRRDDASPAHTTMARSFVAQGRFAAVDSMLNAAPGMRGAPRELQIRREVLGAQRRYPELWQAVAAQRDSGSPQTRLDWMRTSVRVLRTTGRLRAADSLSRALEQRYLEPDLDAKGEALAEMSERILAHVAATSDTSGAKDSLNAALARYPLAELPAADRPYGMLARVAIALGDPALALRWLDERDQLITESARVPRYEALRARAEANAMLGRVAEAKRFAAAGDVGSCIPCTAPTVAFAFESAGDLDSALTVWQTYFNRAAAERIEEDQFRLAHALVRVGELKEQRGALREALAHYDELLTLWTDADPELHARRAAVAARAEAIRARLR